MSTMVSVLHSLTEENPNVRHGAASSNGLTASSNYFCPVKLKRWTEFSYDALEAIYGGELLKAANTEECTLSNINDHKTPPGYNDCNESTTTLVLSQWNNKVVSQALEVVRKSFHACLWTNGPIHFLPEEAKAIINNRSRTPRKPRQCNSRSSSVASSRKGNARLQIKPDASAVRPCPVHVDSCVLGQVERLPKDYKPSNKWTSAEVIEKLTDGDDWNQSGTIDRLARPIRQVYTYCVLTNCRYGCILTTKEAFIFRVGVRDDDIGKYVLLLLDSLTDL